MAARKQRTLTQMRAAPAAVEHGLSELRDSIFVHVARNNLS
jgi:hypothetical protein